MEYSHYHHGSGRPDLAGEHRFGDLGQAIFALLFAAVWIGDTFFLRLTTLGGESIPDWVQLTVGLILLGVSGFLAFSSLRTVFGEVRDPPVVIRTGLFAYIRHPMYLSEVLLYAGFIVMRVSLAAIVVWAGATLFLYLLCRHEEQLLKTRFGDEYRTYMREVPMWIPRLRARRPTP